MKFLLCTFFWPPKVFDNKKVLNDPFKSPRNLQEEFSDCTKVISVISFLHFAEFYLRKLIFEQTCFSIFFIQCFFLKYTNYVCFVFMKIVKLEKKVFDYIKVLDDPFKNPRNLQEQFSDSIKCTFLFTFCRILLTKIIFEHTWFPLFNVYF